MKKFLSLLLVAIFVLSFTACGGDEDIRGSVSTASDASKSAESEASGKEFAMGTTKSNVYENKYIGLGCKLDSNWTFYTDAQIKELNQITADKAGDEFAELMENADLVYDMFVQNANGNNISVNLEKTDAITLATLDMSKFFGEQMKNTLKQTLENMGCTNIQFQDTEVEIGGKKFTALKIISDVNGVKMYQMSIAVKCSKHIASISITTLTSDTLASIIEKFYVVE